MPRPTRIATGALSLLIAWTGAAHAGGGGLERFWPQGVLVHGGRQVVIGLVTGCLAGERFALRLSVAQPGSRAELESSGDCGAQNHLWLGRAAISGWLGITGGLPAYERTRMAGVVLVPAQPGGRDRRGRDRALGR